jgi:site-specific DNA-cytosine methylase
MSGSSIGAAQMRHRYFPVFARIPFGVDEPRVEDIPGGRVVTYKDACGDLSNKWELMQWEGQSYRRKASPWVEAHRLQNGPNRFSNHVALDTGWMAELIKEVCEAGWPPGYDLPRACLHLGIRPKRIERQYVPEENTYRGWNWPMRVKPNRPGYVLTGAGAASFVHWDRPRYLTVAECSRLMGYPDTWHWPATKAMQASMWIGKCCPVQSGQWISDWVANAIEENPGAEGEPIGYRERYHNFTLLYKKWPGGGVPPRPELEA